MTYEQIKRWGKEHAREGGDLFNTWTKDFYYNYVRLYGALTPQKVRVLARGYYIMKTGGV